MNNLFIVDSKVVPTELVATVGILDSRCGAEVDTSGSLPQAFIDKPTNYYPSNLPTLQVNIKPPKWPMKIPC
jgi:hypothetical protein